MTTKPQSTTEPPDRIRVCIRAGKEDWIGVAYAAETDDPSKIHEYVRADLATPASTAPVVDEGPQKMFPPPAEDKLHIAICNAVQSDQFTASDILRQALLDYQPTQLTRSELIRVQQRSGSDEVPAIMVSPAAATAAPELADDLLRDAGAIIIVNEGGAGARVEIRFAELRDAQRLHKTLIQSRATAAPVEQSDSLLAKITQIADIGSAEEFGDAIERLRAIRKLIATANEEAR